MTPQTVGRYEITGELGRGAMGVVYKATDPTIGRTVALKTMRLDVHGLETAEIVGRFKNEARAAGLLNHPNIVTIYDAGEHEGIFYIAMEFMEGITLQQVLDEKRILDADEAIRFSREICEGLDYAHAHGIVHRDVKPANIMITSRGMVKIMDFGIAKAGGSMTSTGQVLGTPNYMSPEQVKGRSLDGRSDLFSFGVILYEMLTGEKPFVGQNVTTIIYKIVNETPIPPHDLDAAIHPGLNAIVIKALAKSPDERYQSGAELVRDLENYKIAGATFQATAALAQPAASHASEKTVVLPMRVVAGSAVRAAEPETMPVRSPVPLRQPAAAARPSRRGGLMAALVVLLVLGIAVGGYALYRARVKMRQLEAQVKSNEAQSAQPQVAQPQVAQPSPAPAASATPADTVIPPDTNAKPADSDQPAQEKSPFKPKRPANLPAAVPPSELTFTSQPAGAKVAVDGQSDPAWITPFKAQHLTAGTHNVVFSKDGYIAQTRTLEVVAGKSASLSAELSQAAKVVVGSNPSGASIWVDGKDSGTVTPSQLMLEAGQHQIILKQTGYKDGFWAGGLTAGQTTNVAPVMLSLNQQAEKGPSQNILNRFLGSDAIPDGKGLVHIRTVPEGATIIIDGRVAPKKTNSKWPANPGVYSIDLQMPGYKTIHRNIQVKQGKITPLDEILERQ
jgi:predicted Ser/Thr protein kinase